MTCTCITGHSNNLTWTINQFPGQLQFAASQQVMTRQNAPEWNAFAVLINKSDSNGVELLESDLIVVPRVQDHDIFFILTCSGQTSHSMIIPIYSTCKCV